MPKDPGHLDFQQRAREKQAARDADELALASGRLSAQQINEKNSMFSALGPNALRNAKVIFPEKK